MAKPDEEALLCEKVMKTMGLIKVWRRIIPTLCAAGIVVAAGCATTPRKHPPSEKASNG